MNKTLHNKHLMPAAVLFAFIGLAGGPAAAQQTQAQQLQAQQSQTHQAPPKWNPRLEAVIVSAMHAKNYRMVLSSTHLGEAFVVTASLDVPYSDLHLASEADAAELGRRIHVAAHLVCVELDRKYPPNLYPIIEGDNCEHNAAVDGMERANQVIAAAKS